MQRATDHLANERTFLAWVRTGIALMGFGVVIARLRFLGYEQRSFHLIAGLARSTWLGLAFAVIGLFTLIFAVVTYNRTRLAIDTGDYKPLHRSLIVFVSIIFLLGVFAVGYLLTLGSS